MQLYFQTINHSPDTQSNVASDSEDESTMGVGLRTNIVDESDTGDTPVARTTKRTARVIESDEEMSDQDMVKWR